MDAKLRAQVWKRARDICEYCRMPQQFDVSKFEVEYVIALKHLGPTQLDNLALACYSCNAHKGSNIAGLDPFDGKLTRLFHPRSDIWDNNFQWNGAYLVGTTAEGRTTVEVLRINLPMRVELRQALIREGVFPSL